MTGIRVTTDASVPASATPVIYIAEDSNQDGTTDKRAKFTLPDGVADTVLYGFAGSGDYHFEVFSEQATTDDVALRSLEIQLAATTVNFNDGSTWVDIPVKYHDGSSWLTISAIRRYDGSAWVEI